MGVKEVSVGYGDTLEAASAEAATPLGFKRTEVGVIPDDWTVQSLGDVAIANWGNTSITKDKYKDSGFQAYSASGPDGYVDWFEHDSPAVVLSAIGAQCGKTWLTNEKWTAIKNTIWFRADGREADTRFLYRVTANPRFWPNRGQAQPFIALGDVREALLPLPPMAEQEAIAEALSDADALIESLEQLIAKKRQIKQGTMQALLTGKQRLPGFQVKHGYKQTEAGVIPKDWDAKCLGVLARRICRGASPRPIDDPVWFDENSEIGWVRISDVTKSGRYLFETTQRLSERGVRHSRYLLSGALIMSICATVGRPVETCIDVCIHDGFVVFEQPVVVQNFLYHLLKDLEPRWSNKGQTGSQMNLNTGLIKSTVVAVPSDEAEQTAIATVLSDMDTELAELETRLAKTRQLKQGMMQALLTGRIRLV